MLLIKQFNFVLTKDLPSISQSNVQAVTAKNEEQYTLNNMIYIKLQNCYFFFFEVYFEGDTPKMYTNQLKDVCNGVHFLTKLQTEGRHFTKKMLLYKYFSRFLIRFVLELSLKSYSKFYKLPFPRKPFSKGC